MDLLYIDPQSAQEWTNLTPNATNLSISCFLVLPVVNRQLLRLLSTYILVEYGVIANYNMKLINILYH